MAGPTVASNQLSSSDSNDDDTVDDDTSDDHVVADEGTHTHCSTLLGSTSLCSYWNDMLV